MRYSFLFLSCFIFFSCKKNTLKVICQDKIENNLKIELSVMNKSGIVIYNKSKKITQIPDEYGENDWKLEYNDSLCCKIRHFKTNANNTHSYSFTIRKVGNNLLCDIAIRGEDELIKTIKFTSCF